MAITKGVAELSVLVTADSSRAQAELRKMEEVGARSSRSLRESMTEGRAGIKQLGEEIGINLNRHLISFLAKLPGVAPAMAAAFPVAAVVGIGGALVEAGKKLVEFVDRNREAASKISEGFATMHQSSKLATDELAVSNDKLEAQIAKLMGQRPNSLKLMLDEARVAADKLVESLAKADKEQEALLKNKDNQVTAAGGFFMFKMATSGAEAVVARQAKELRELAEEFQRKADDAKTIADRDKVQAESRLQLMEKEKAQLKDLQDLYNQISSDRQKGSLALDPSAFLAIIGGRAHSLEDLMRSQSEQARGQDLAKGLTQAKDSGERLQEAQRELERRKILHQMSIGEEVLYWQQYRNVFSEGTQQWIEANRKYEEAQAQFAKNFTERGKLAEPLKKWQEEQATPAPASATRDVGMEWMADIGRWGENWKQFNSALGENALIHAKVDQAAKLAQIRIMEETGAITRQQAALSEAQIKLLAYREEMAAIQKQARDLSSDSGLTEAQRSTSLQQLQNKLDELTGQQFIAQAETDALAKGLQLRNEMGVMFNEWIQRAEDVKAQMRSLWEQFSGSLNSEMSKALTGQRTNFSGAFRSVGATAVNYGLQHAEAGIMQHIPGLAKLLGNASKLGTQGNPMYVRLADPVGGLLSPTASSAMQQWKSAGGGSTFGSFLSTIGGLFGAGAKAFGGGGMPSLATDFSLDSFQLPFQDLASISVPAMAFGGPVLAGMPYDIGEMGRERFVPESNGRIVPNHMLDRGGTYYEIHAEGADAAAIQQRVARALEQVHGSAVRNAIAVAAERRRRIPSAYRG